MEVKAKLNALRISPRKVRLIADLIRGMDVQRAELELANAPQRSSMDLQKLLKSAIANARHNFELEKDVLFIKEIFVDGGVVMKRQMPRAFGRAAIIRKRTSNISLTLSTERELKGKNEKVKTTTKN